MAKKESTTKAAKGAPKAGKAAFMKVTNQRKGPLILPRKCIKNFHSNDCFLRPKDSVFVDKAAFDAELKVNSVLKGWVNSKWLLLDSSKKIHDHDLKDSRLVDAPADLLNTTNAAKELVDVSPTRIATS